MDKHWIVSDRLSTEYEVGVDRFLNFAMLNAENCRSIRYS